MDYCIYECWGNRNAITYLWRAAPLKFLEERAKTPSESNTSFAFWLGAEADNAA